MQQVPVYARAQDLAHLLELKKAGAADVILENAEVAINCIYAEAYFPCIKGSFCNYYLFSFMWVDQFTAGLQAS